MKSFFLCILILLFTAIASASDFCLPFRESDPASYIEGVCVIDGSFTQAETDLAVEGLPALTMTRFYDSRDAWEKASFGGWRAFPQCKLLVQRDPEQDFTTSEGRFQYCSCEVGMPEGSGLTFIGWQNVDHPTSSSKFLLDHPFGMVNTASGVINGWSNRNNHCLVFQGDHWELTTSTGGKKNLSPIWRSLSP